MSFPGTYLMPLHIASALSQVIAYHISGIVPSFEGCVQISISVVFFTSSFAKFCGADGIAGKRKQRRLLNQKAPILLKLLRVSYTISTR